MRNAALIKYDIGEIEEELAELKEELASLEEERWSIGDHIYVSGHGRYILGQCAPKTVVALALSNGNYLSDAVLVKDIHSLTTEDIACITGHSQWVEVDK